MVSMVCVGVCGRGAEVGGGWTGVEVLGLRLLPGDQGAGLRLAGGGGGGAELREAAVARLQAGHGTPEARDGGRVSGHKLPIGTAGYLRRRAVQPDQTHRREIHSLCVALTQAAAMSTTVSQAERSCVRG